MSHIDVAERGQSADWRISSTHLCWSGVGVLPSDIACPMKVQSQPLPADSHDDEAGNVACKDHLAALSAVFANPFADAKRAENGRGPPIAIPEWGIPRPLAFIRNGLLIHGQLS